MHQQLCNMHQQKWPKCLIVNFNGGHRGSEFLTGPQLLAVSGTAPYRRTDPKIHAWRSQKQSSPDGNHDERVISQCSVQSRWSWWCRCIQRRHLCSPMLGGSRLLNESGEEWGNIWGALGQINIFSARRLLPVQWRDEMINAVGGGPAWTGGPVSCWRPTGTPRVTL